MGPSPPCVGPKANGLKQATRIDRNRKARTTAIARRGIKVGLGTDETVSRPRPMMHSLLAVTSACAASCATNQRIAPGRARTCNTATCAAYRPASAMECYLLHHGGQNGAGSPTSEEDAHKKAGVVPAWTTPCAADTISIFPGIPYHEHSNGFKIPCLKRRKGSNPFSGNEPDTWLAIRSRRSSGLGLGYSLHLVTVTSRQIVLRC